MATLSLIRFEDGTLALQGLGDASRNADFSLYDLDGEGGDPFDYGNRTWEVVDGLPAVEYNDSCGDSFFAAQEDIVIAARAAGIKLPDYVE